MAHISHDAIDATSASDEEALQRRRSPPTLLFHFYRAMAKPGRRGMACALTAYTGVNAPDDYLLQQ